MFITHVGLIEEYKKILFVNHPIMYFPKKLIRKCLFTLILWFVISAVFAKGIFIIVAIFAFFAFAWFYYVFMKIWRLFGLSVLKFTVSMLFFCSFIAVIITYIRNYILSFLH